MPERGERGGGTSWLSWWRNLPNPGKLEELKKEATAVLSPDVFEGARFEFNKTLTQKFALLHNVTLATGQPGTYEFGAHFGDESMLLASRIDMQGRMNGRLNAQLNDAVLMRMQAQVAPDALVQAGNASNSFKADLDYKGAAFCANGYYVGGGLLGASYLRSVTEGLGTRPCAGRRTRARPLTEMRGSVRARPPQLSAARCFTTPPTGRRAAARVRRAACGAARERILQPPSSARLGMARSSCRTSARSPRRSLWCAAIQAQHEARSAYKHEQATHPCGTLAKKPKHDRVGPSTLVRAQASEMQYYHNQFCQFGLGYEFKLRNAVFKGLVSSDTTCSAVLEEHIQP